MDEPTGDAAAKDGHLMGRTRTGPYRAKHSPELLDLAAYLRRRWHATYREIAGAISELHPEIEGITVYSVYYWTQGRLGSDHKYTIDGRRRPRAGAERERDRLKKQRLRAQRRQARERLYRQTRGG